MGKGFNWLCGILREFAKCWRIFLDFLPADIPSICKMGGSEEEELFIEQELEDLKVWTWCQLERLYSLN